MLQLYKHMNIEGGLIKLEIHFMLLKQLFMFASHINAILNEGCHTTQLKKASCYQEP